MKIKTFCIHKKSSFLIHFQPTFFLLNVDKMTSIEFCLLMFDIMNFVRFPQHKKITSTNEIELVIYVDFVYNNSKEWKSSSQKSRKEQERYVSLQSEKSKYQNLFLLYFMHTIQRGKFKRWRHKVSK